MKHTQKESLITGYTTLHYTHKYVLIIKMRKTCLVLRYFVQKVFYVYNESDL